MIEAVIFDMDGLMFDTETLSVKGWIAAGKDQDFPITEEMIYGIFGLNPAELNQFWINRFGETFDHEKAMAVRLAYMKDYVETKGVPIKPGLMELLEFLKKENYKIIIASSSQEHMIRLYLKLGGLDEYFEYYISGNDVKAGKPAPDIFLKAAQVLEVSPTSCMVFEDSLVGIEAAYRAGMKPVMVPDKVAPDQKTKAYLYAELKTLKEGIALLRAQAV